MTTFTKLWVLKSDTMVPAGTVIEVSLKNGSRKSVAVGAFLGKRGDSFLFAPAVQSDDQEAA
jgi:hypothetical protein